MGTQDPVSEMTPEERYRRIAVDAENDPHIIGFVVTGSRGKDFATERSDYDLVLVVEDGQLEAYRNKYAERYDGIDLTVFDISGFRDHAAIGSRFAWDRYSYAHLKARIDKRNGEIQGIIDEKGRLPTGEIGRVVWGACDHYVNQFYRALKCLRDGDEKAAKLELAEAVGPLLGAMFALHGRVGPYYKFLGWELENYPLTLFPWEPAKLHEMLLDLSSRVDPATIKEILRETERVFRQHGHGGVFDTWDDHLDWMKS